MTNNYEEQINHEVDLLPEKWQADWDQRWKAISAKLDPLNAKGLALAMVRERMRDAGEI